MKFTELKKHLLTQVKSAYSLYGDDSFLCENSIELIEKKLFGEILRNNLNKQVFSTENIDISNFINALNTLPFFAEKKLVILKEYDNKKNNELYSHLESYLKNPSESTVLIIHRLFESEALNLKQNIEAVDCNRLDKLFVNAFIKQKLTKQNATIEDDAALTLIDYTNGYLSKINLELDKLVPYTNGKITKNSVEQIVSKDLEYSIFELTDSLANGNFFKAQQIKQNLLENKKTSGSVLGLIQNFFRRMFYATITTEPISEIATQLKVKEFAITKAKNLGKKFGALNLKKIMELCAELDYKTKTSQITVENATELLILTIQNMQQK